MDASSNDGTHTHFLKKSIVDPLLDEIWPIIRNSVDGVKPEVLDQFVPMMRSDRYTGYWRDHNKIRATFSGEGRL